MNIRDIIKEIKKQEKSSLRLDAKKKIKMQETSSKCKRQLKNNKHKKELKNDKI